MVKVRISAHLRTCKAQGAILGSRILFKRKHGAPEHCFRAKSLGQLSLSLKPFRGSTKHKLIQGDLTAAIRIDDPWQPQVFRVSAFDRYSQSFRRCQDLS